MAIQLDATLDASVVAIRTLISHLDRPRRQKLADELAADLDMTLIPTDTLVAEREAAQASQLAIAGLYREAMSEPTTSVARMPDQSLWILAASSHVVPDGQKLRAWNDLQPYIAQSDIFKRPMIAEINDFYSTTVTAAAMTRLSRVILMDANRWLATVKQPASRPFHARVLGRPIALLTSSVDEGNPKETEARLMSSYDPLLLDWLVRKQYERVLPSRDGSPDEPYDAAIVSLLLSCIPSACPMTLFTSDGSLSTPFVCPVPILTSGDAYAVSAIGLDAFQAECDALIQYLDTEQQRLARDTVCIIAIVQIHETDWACCTIDPRSKQVCLHCVHSPAMQTLSMSWISQLFTPILTALSHDSAKWSFSVSTMYALSSTLTQASLGPIAILTAQCLALGFGPTPPAPSAPITSSFPPSSSMPIIQVSPWALMTDGVARSLRLKQLFNLVRRFQVGTRILDAAGSSGLHADRLRLEDWAGLLQTSFGSSR